MRFPFQRLIWLTLLVCALAAPKIAVCQEPTAPEAAPKSSEPAITAANDSPAPNPSKDSTKPAAPVEEPPIYYLRDQQGRLIPMLGFTYEDFMEFFRQKQSKAAPAKPAEYSVEQLTMSGQLRDDHIELVADYKIQLAASTTVEVPLVSGAVLLEPATYEGPGEHEVLFDSASSGYRLKLNGKERSEHRVSLKLMAPVKTTGPQHQLQLSIPTAAASKLSIHVAKSPVELVSHAGAAAAEAEKSAQGGSNLTLWGIGGPIALTWNDTEPGTRPSVVLEAVGKILAQVDRRSAEFDARLSVRSLGGPFDRFHVALPLGARLIGGSPAESAYTLDRPRKTAGNKSSKSSCRRKPPAPSKFVFTRKAFTTRRAIVVQRPVCNSPDSKSRRPRRTVNLDILRSQSPAIGNRLGTS